jgi:hypothetical protein
MIKESISAFDNFWEILALETDKKQQVENYRTENTTGKY